MDTTTKPTTSQVSPSDIFKFIRLYKSFEALSLKHGFALIKEILKNNKDEFHKISHLCDQWKWKDRHFGEFWMNLDYGVQIAFLKYWGFQNPGAEEFLRLQDEDPLRVLWMDPPPLIKALHDTVMFFENHAVEDVEDIKLPSVPPVDKQFGNATNWGEYILSLAPVLNYETHDLIKKIGEYYLNRNQAR
jgi:hypothetical protein